MSSEDRRRILQLVADGKITAEEAAELLDALPKDGQSEATREPTDFGGPALQFPPGPQSPEWPRPPARARALIIQITDGSDSHVNLRIPFGLARAAGKFVPRRAQQQLKEFGIDLQELLDDLRGSENGTILQVNDDDSHVLIAVE
jgi:hypothetical protein